LGNYYQIEKDGKYGLISDRNILIEPIYNKIKKTDDRYFYIKKGNKYGLGLFEDGEILIEPICNSIKKFDHNYFVIKINQKHGLIKDKEIVLEPIYDSIKKFDYSIVSLSDSYFRIEINGKFGLLKSVNNNIEIIEKPDFNLITIEKKVIFCDNCGGSGSISADPNCNYCGGKGAFDLLYHDTHASNNYIICACTSCSICSGSGRLGIEFNIIKN
jgi:hypothetical protein